MFTAHLISKSVVVTKFFLGKMKNAKLIVNASVLTVPTTLK